MISHEYYNKRVMIKCTLGSRGVGGWDVIVVTRGRLSRSGLFGFRLVGAEKVERRGGETDG